MDDILDSHAHIWAHAKVVGILNRNSFKLTHFDKAHKTLHGWDERKLYALNL